MALRQGSKVIIVSDNENYSDWVNRKLIVTHASNRGRYYDETMYPEMLCELEDSETGKRCPFALYEYELGRL